MAKQYQISFTNKELEDFGHLASSEWPMVDMKKWLDATDSKAKRNSRWNSTDSVEGRASELAMWIRFSRLANFNAEVAIKGDAEPIIKL